MTGGPYQLVPLRKPARPTVPSLVAVGIVLLLGLVALHGGSGASPVWSGRTVTVDGTLDAGARARLRAAFDSPSGRDRIAAVLGTVSTAPAPGEPAGDRAGRHWVVWVVPSAVAATGTATACRAALAAAGEAACPAIVAAVGAVRDRYPGAARIWVDVAETGRVRAGTG